MTGMMQLTTQCRDWQLNASTKTGRLHRPPLQHVGSSIAQQPPHQPIDLAVVGNGSQGSSSGQVKHSDGAGIQQTRHTATTCAQEVPAAVHVFYQNVSSLHVSSITFLGVRGVCLQRQALACIYLAGHH